MDGLPWRVVYEVPRAEVVLGSHRVDVTHRALVLGDLGSVGDQTAGIDPVLRRAEQMEAAGADALHLDALTTDVAPIVAALHDRVAVPLSVGTQEAAVLVPALAAGAVVGVDASGFADPSYLPAALAAGASVVAGPGLATTPTAPTSVAAVADSLRAAIARAAAAGLPSERVLVDAGLDAGVTRPESLDLLRAHDRLSALGQVVVVSVAAHPVQQGAPSEPAALALAIALGARVLRVHDVRAARRTADVMAAVLAARRAS